MTSKCSDGRQTVDGVMASADWIAANGTACQDALNPYSQFKGDRSKFSANSVRYGNV